MLQTGAQYSAKTVYRKYILNAIERLEELHCLGKHIHIAELEALNQSLVQEYLCSIDTLDLIAFTEFCTEEYIQQHTHTLGIQCTRRQAVFTVLFTVLHDITCRGE
jgi:hypothetical protein